MSGMTTFIALSSQEQKDLEKLHSTWPLNILPNAAKPYAELLRITKPAGVFMFYLPCIYGTFLIGALGVENDLYQLLSVNFHLFALSFLLRGALCTWNDILDRDFDRQVKRTRIRALARGGISVRAASIYLATQTVLICLYFRSLPWKCTIYAIPFLAVHIIYPFAKRFTNHPQLLLGFAHCNGVFLSFPALRRTIPVQWTYDPTLWSVLGLASAIVFWTVLNDTVYAAQDTADDKAAGIGSTTVYWGTNAKPFLRMLAVLTVASLLVVSYTLGNLSLSKGMIYTALTCGGAAAGLFSMVEWVDLDEPGSCAWWFNNGNIMVGMAIASGFVAAYFA